MRWSRVLMVGLGLALSFGCERSVPEPVAPVPVVAEAEPPPPPPPPPPRVLALYPAKAPAFGPGRADAGAPRMREVVGPALARQASVVDDAWSLSQMPKRFVWEDPAPPPRLEVRLVDGAGMPWPSRVVRLPRPGGGLRFEVEALAPFSTGARYRLVAEGSGGPSWAVPLLVETGVDVPQPWEGR